MRMVVLDVVGVRELVMDFEVGGGHDLEKRLSVEVDFIEVAVFLVVDIGVGESE